MALRLDLKFAIPLVIIPSIASNIVVMIQAGHFHEALRRFWPLYVSSVPGLLFSLSLLVMIAPVAAKAILGLVLIAYALWALSNKSFSLSDKWERNLKLPMGVLYGFRQWANRVSRNALPALPAIP